MLPLIKLNFIISLISSFFPTPGYLYIQGVLALFQFSLIVYSLFSHKLSLKKVFNKYTITLTVVFIFALVGVLWAKDFNRWIVYLGTFFVGWIHSFSISILIEQKNFIPLLVKVILVCIVIQNLVGWYEVITGQYHFTSNIGNIEYSRIMRRPLSFFKNVNDYATFLLFSLTFLVSWKPNISRLKNIPPIIHRISRYLLVFSTTILIYLTQSRGIQLATVLLFAFHLYYKIPEGTTKKKVRNTILMASLFLITFLLVLFTPLDINSLEDGDSRRIYLILNGIEYLKDTFLVGTGAGSIPYYLENFQYFDVAHIRNIHNWWIEFLVMYGLLFFIVYVVYYMYATIKSYFYAKKYPNIFIKFTAHWSIVFIIGSMISSSLFTTIWVMLVHNIIFIVFEKYESDKSIRLFK